MKKLLLSLALFCTGSHAAITDGKFGINQIFDVQYYWSGNTLNASNFIAPYDKNFQTVTVTSGQYFQFFNSTTNPGTYGLKLMNSDGTQSRIVHDTGDITALGSGAIFYIGSGFFGNVITTTQGYSYGSSATFTNMDTSVSSADLSSYTFASSTPLAAGQTAQAPPTYGVNFTRITSYDWATYTAGSQPVGSEQAHEAFDNDNGSKWFGFRSQGAWVIAKLASKSKAVQKIQFVTANDAAERDPTGYRIWGSMDGINWTLIKEESISLPAGRLTASSVYSLGNVTSYLYYKVEFTGTKSGGDAFQVAEIRLLYDVDDPQGTLAGGGEPAVYATGTSTTNQVTSSSSSSNTSSITVTRPTTTGNYSDVYVGTTTVTTTTTTPVTTTTYSDGSSTTSNGSSTTTTSTTYTISPTLGTAPVYSRTAPNTAGNSIYVKQIYAWNNTQVTLEQNGNNNAITGTDSGWATVDGNGSLINVKQYGQGNIVGLKMNAWGNNINILQGTPTADVNGNILNLESFGNGNGTTLRQETNNNTASIKMTDSINTVNLTQKGGMGNTSYVTINGNWNTVNNTQNGSNNLSLINMSGDQNVATVNQTGNDHSSLLNLINAGGRNNVSVTQTGAGDTYSLQQTCTNPAGCSVSVIRNR